MESLLHMREMDEQLFQQLHGLHEVLREKCAGGRNVHCGRGLDATGATNDAAIN